MLQRISKIFLLLLCVWLLTGPQALLQLGAWSWMLASYSQESSFGQAVAETFGNERPCKLCRLIDAAEAAEDDSPIAQSGQKEIKLMLCLGRGIQVEAPQASSEWMRAFVCEPKNALALVPTPPPRAA
ncbi:MAG: hypothetical protein ACNA77_09645 [Opitutales bacterium]